MKNTDVFVFITTKSGWTQTYHKKGRRWEQTSPPMGIVRKLTCEQFLSHLLPVLVEGSRRSIRVEPLMPVCKDEDEEKEGEK